MGSQFNALYYFLKYVKLHVSSTDKVISKSWIIFAQKKKCSIYKHQMKRISYNEQIRDVANTLLLDSFRPYKVVEQLSNYRQL
jgi:hypothetical protein